MLFSHQRSYWLILVFVAIFHSYYRDLKGRSTFQTSTGNLGYIGDIVLQQNKYKVLKQFWQCLSLLYHHSLGWHSAYTGYRIKRFRSGRTDYVLIPPAQSNRRRRHLLQNGVNPYFYTSVSLFRVSFLMLFCSMICFEALAIFLL